MTTTTVPTDSPPDFPYKKALLFSSNALKRMAMGKVLMVYYLH
jgi:hypothetical protein